MFCVNALNRAFLISTARIEKIERSYSHVSMPLIGLSSFLPQKILLDIGFYAGVNALNRAFLISTMKLLEKMESQLLCQCP